MKAVVIIGKLLMVVIVGQTLFFKFTGASESIYIFEQLGAEPYGRIGSGIVELLASILILIPRITLLGALLAFATMLGAIASHLFVLGIEVQNDGGTLFFLALITSVCSCYLIFHERNKIADLLKLKI